MSQKLKFFLLLGPFLLFVVLAFLFIFRLITVDPNHVEDVPNALAGKPVPKTAIPLLDGNGEINPQSFFKGRVILVNFWGSWCKECRIEHPTLTELSKDTRFELIGINYRDSKDNADRFLNTYGNPYKTIGFDPRGRIAIDWGVYGAPETFLVDKNGLIRYKQIGVMTPENFQINFLPRIEKLLQE